MKYVILVAFMVGMCGGNFSFASPSNFAMFEVESSLDRGKKKKRRHKRIGKKRKRKCKRYARRGFAG
jgi:hypothetical protein